MPIFDAIAGGLGGVAQAIASKKKKRRKRRKARQKRQQQRDAVKNQLNAGFNTTPQSADSAMDNPSVQGMGRSDNTAQAGLSNPVMIAIVALIAWKFLFKK